MAAPRKYPEELGQWAIWLVLGAREQDVSLSLNAAVTRIGPRVGVNADTLRTWCKQAEVDTGPRPGTTTSDAARIKELDREVKELKRANEILLAASSFFARELDRDCRGDRVHRWSSGTVRGRADLHGADRARLQDRPVRLLRVEDTAAVSASGPRPGRVGTRPSGAGEPEDRSSPLRCSQGLR